MNLDEIELSYKNIRHIYIGVKGAKVFVRAPIGTSALNIQKQLLRAQKWLDKQIAKQQSAQSRALELRQLYANEGKFYLWGQLANHQTSKQIATEAYLQASTICSINSSAFNCCDELSALYKQQTEHIVFALARHFAALLNIDVLSYQTSKAKSYLGCANYRKRQIKFNYLLAAAPIQCAVYVALHECAHFIHHNHSQDFYRLIAKFMPEHKAIAKFTKDFIAKLPR